MTKLEKEIADNMLAEIKGARGPERGRLIGDCDLLMRAAAHRQGIEADSSQSASTLGMKE